MQTVRVGRRDTPLPYWGDLNGLEVFAGTLEGLGYSLGRDALKVGNPGEGKPLYKVHIDDFPLKYS